MKLNASLIRYFNDVLDLIHTGKKVRGWRTYKRSGKNLDAYYNKKLGVVIKFQYFILDSRTPNKFKVPTFKLDNDGYVVQPIVEKKNLALAVSKLRTKIKPHLKRGIFPDLHVGNVGWYKGKPLMFDW
jgi:hypothetical protein